MMTYLGLDIGGTRCSAVVGDTHGTIYDQVDWLSDTGRGLEAVIGDLLRHADNLRLRFSEIRTIGVSIGGPIDVASGIVHSPPNLPGWDQVSLRKILFQHFRLPCWVEHDASACALAEWWWGGSDPAPRRLIYLTCGTGLGAGFVVDGAIYRGARGGSCEIGHLLYRDDGPKAYGRRGCFEAFASAKALGLLASWRFPDRWPISPASKEICRLHQSGDPDATEVVRLSSEALGEACSLLIDLLEPDAIVLGSLAEYLGDRWCDAVRSRCETSVIPERFSRSTIRRSSLGPRLQPLSALAAARLADEQAPVLNMVKSSVGGQS